MSKIGYIRHLSKSESIDLQLLKLRVMVVIVYSLKARQEETRFTRSKPTYFFQYSFNEI